MRKALCKLDKIIILCKSVDKTSSIYCETLGLRVFVQSPQFAQLRDSHNTAIYLQQSRNPAHLSKGYSPILSFNVQHFDQVYNKLIKYELIPDGQVVQTKEGKLATFLGLDGETISINNMETGQEGQDVEVQKQESLQNDEIKRLLEKIRL